MAIQSSPREFSDCKESDSAGRPVDIHICHKYAIKYWEDHADQHIKIWDVRMADKL